MKGKAFAHIVVSSVVVLLAMLSLVPSTWADEVKHVTLKVEGWF